MIGIDLINSLLTARGVNNMKVCDYFKFRTVKYNYKRHLSTIMHKTASRFISENELNTTKKIIEQNYLQITVHVHLSSDDQQCRWDEVYEEIGDND